jgi:thiol-disulfide isomerase/thioredoxin
MADYFSNNRYVKELRPSDFDSSVPNKLKNGGCGLVLFYAPWCGHCKSAKQEWETAAKKVGFCDYYAFNCDKYKEHVAKINDSKSGFIDGYPTIVIYKNGVPFENFTGDRTSQGFIKACMGTCKS